MTCPTISPFNHGQDSRLAVPEQCGIQQEPRGKAVLSRGVMIVYDVHVGSLRRARGGRCRLLKFDLPHCGFGSCRHGHAHLEDAVGERCLDILELDAFW